MPSSLAARFKRAAFLFVAPIGLLSVVAAVASAGAQVSSAECPDEAVFGAARLTVTPRADNALVAEAAIELSAAAPLYLEYGNDEAGWLRTPTAQAKVSHDLLLLRLRAESRYGVRAFALSEAGCAAMVGQGQFRSGKLPADFGKLVAAANGQPTLPLTMMDIRVDQIDIRWLIVLDAEGQVVWYYSIPRYLLQASPGRGANGLARLSSGNLLYLARNYGLEEIAPDARALRRFRLRGSDIHHDLLELSDGRILYLGAEERFIDDSPNRGSPRFRMRGDTLNILDLDADFEWPVWRAFDSLDPLQRNPHYATRIEDGALEWTHGNSVTLGPRGNVIVSFRHLDQVISLSPDFETVEWRLGGPGSSFSFPSPEDRFYGQHAAAELAGGRVLVFDNGNFRPEGEFSRALELELDFDQMTARKVWEYRHQPDIMAGSQSNVVRLSNGNTLVNFGSREFPDEPVILVETTPDGSLAWELELRVAGQRTTRYRVYPLDSLAGEAPIAGPQSRAGENPVPQRGVLAGAGASSDR